MVSLEVGLARVMQFMFGGFSLCMLYSAETMFGPKSPGGAMIYWNTTMGPMGDWFARALGCVSISILLGPVCFGVPLMAFLKQHLLLNVLILGLFAQAVMMPVGNTLMMQIQLGVQVVLTMVNAYVVAKDMGYIKAKAAARGKTPKRGSTPMKKK